MEIYLMLLVVSSKKTNFSGVLFYGGHCLEDKNFSFLGRPASLKLSYWYIFGSVAATLALSQVAFSVKEKNYLYKWRFF